MAAKYLNDVQLQRQIHHISTFQRIPLRTSRRGFLQKHIFIGLAQRIRGKKQYFKEKSCGKFFHFLHLWNVVGNFQTVRSNNSNVSFGLNCYWEVVKS
jgi:hypothetical protein